jgi:hypothetical protein
LERDFKKNQIKSRVFRHGFNVYVQTFSKPHSSYQV